MINQTRFCSIYVLQNLRVFLEDIFCVQFRQQISQTYTAIGVLTLSSHTFPNGRWVASHTEFFPFCVWINSLRKGGEVLESPGGYWLGPAGKTATLLSRRGDCPVLSFQCGLWRRRLPGRRHSDLEVSSLGHWVGGGELVTEAGSGRRHRFG